MVDFNLVALSIASLLVSFINLLFTTKSRETNMNYYFYIPLESFFIFLILYF